MYRGCRKAAELALLDASQVLKMSCETLVKIEYFEHEPHPLQVLKMCELYGAGKLLAQWHCANQCSIGKFCGRQFTEMIPALAGMQLLGSIEELTGTRIDLVKVLQDGMITLNELPVVDDILDKCHSFTRAAIALEMEREKAAGLAHRRL